MSRLSKDKIGYAGYDCEAIDIDPILNMDCDTNKYLLIPRDVKQEVSSAPFYIDIKNLVHISGYTSRIKHIGFDKTIDYINSYRYIKNLAPAVIPQPCFENDEECEKPEQLLPGYLVPTVPIIPFMVLPEIDIPDVIIPNIPDPDICFCFSMPIITSIQYDQASQSLYYVKQDIQKCYHHNPTEEEVELLKEEDETPEEEEENLNTICEENNMQGDTSSSMVTTFFGQPKKITITTAKNCEEVGEECNCETADDFQIWDIEEEKCVDKPCAENKHYDRKIKKCVDNNCPPNEEWNYCLGGCSKTGDCSKGYQWDVDKDMCIKEKKD